MRNGQYEHKSTTEKTYKEHVNGNLFALVLEIVDVGSRHTLGSIRKYTCIVISAIKVAFKAMITLPASVRLPLRV